jgi:glucan phosphoethanolaminetransferase (alkaline phosphatase superfamily)
VSEPPAQERQARIAAVVSLAPVIFGIGFAFYAFTTGTVSSTRYDGVNETVFKETIVESGGAAGVALALAPLILGIFLAVLLRFARSESDLAAIYMAWAFSGFLALVSVIAVITLGPFMVIPAILMLIATGFSHRVVRQAT